MLNTPTWFFAPKFSKGADVKNYLYSSPMDFEISLNYLDIVQLVQNTFYFCVLPFYYSPPPFPPIFLPVLVLTSPLEKLPIWT